MVPSPGTTLPPESFTLFGSSGLNVDRNQVSISFSILLDFTADSLHLYESWTQTLVGFLGGRDFIIERSVLLMLVMFCKVTAGQSVCFVVNSEAAGL